MHKKKTTVTILDIPKKNPRKKKNEEKPDPFSGVGIILTANMISLSTAIGNTP